MAKRKNMANVYVVKMSDEVLDIRKFRIKNPKHKTGMDCLYVGYTHLDPEERFINHKRGHKHNRWVKKYGIRLLPEHYDEYNPMEVEEAKRKEIELAEALRAKGYAVHQR